MGHHKSLTPFSHLSKKHSSVSVFPEASVRTTHAPQPRTNTAFPPFRTAPKSTRKSPVSPQYQRLEIELARERHVGSNPTSSAIIYKQSFIERWSLKNIGGGIRTGGKRKADLKGGFSRPGVKASERRAERIPPPPPLKI